MKLIKTLNILFCVLFLSTLAAQFNPSVITAKVVENDTFVFELNSSIKPIIIDYPDGNAYTEVGNFTLIAPKKYSGLFIPKNNFKGQAEFVVETSDPDAFIPGWGAPGYTTINISVVPSTITNACHVVDLSAGVNDMNIDISGFNFSSSGDIPKVKAIANVQNTTAVVFDSITLSTTIQDQNNIAIVQYLVEDSLSTTNLSKVFIRPFSYSVPDTLSLFTTPNSSLDLIFDKTAYVPSGNYLGNISGITSGAFSYTAGSGNYIDTIYFASSNGNKLVTIRCIDRNNDNRFVVDDLVFTERANHVTFDVFANDLKDGYNITNHSSELLHDTLGIFTFYPDPWYIGEKEFFYTAYNGFEHQEGKITIKVDDYLPNTEKSYAFTTFTNESYVLDYNIPVNDYLFSVESSPTHGVVSVKGSNDTISTNCQTITGPAVLEYIPAPGFMGNDYFELEYCTITGGCTIVKVDVEVVSNPDPSYCHCIGGDCVWPGDLNNDGIVSQEDLLPLGFYLGFEGSNRIDYNYSVPRGQHSDNWDTDFSLEAYDIKHLDSNGDGVITASDADAISTNFGKINNLVSNEWEGQSKIGLQFIPRFTSIDSGDLVIIDIAIGSDVFPVSDMQGLSLDLNINSDIVDSASVEMIYHKNSWFSYNSPLLEITKQPSDGHIQTAFTRTDPSLATGNGIIATLQFIGEDDLDGFKLAEDTKYIPFTVEARNITMMNRSGRSVRLADALVELTMNVDNQKEASSTSDIVVYPNPVQHNLYVVDNINNLSANAEIELIDVSGNLLYSAKYETIYSNGIDVRTLPTGVYLIRVLDQGELSTHKFIKF